MLPFREASVGQPILTAIAATVVIVAAPARYQGVPVVIIGWILLAWSLVWLVGEIIANGTARSEEHTSELQSRGHLVCRLLLEKKKKQKQRKYKRSTTIEDNNTTNMTHR